MRGPVIAEAIPPRPPPPPKRPTHQVKTWGLLLASYTTKAAAEKGWVETMGQHGALLGKLRPPLQALQAGPWNPLSPRGRACHHP
ncbi:MAG: hypothetical protein FD153_1790 [Rhodospirillaceae bacterium]|nr:MAG: hypothetical protein FD153_1790 [Rhodospirillaceae bacterium]